MAEWEKRKKWLTRKGILKCLLLSAAILTIAVLFQFAQLVVTSDLPSELKGLYVLVMWLVLAGMILLYALLSPDLMETVSDMLGYRKDEEDQKDAGSETQERASGD
jgi:amino acid transporter